MRSIVSAAALLAALARTAAAGPGTEYTFICRPELHVVSGDPEIRFISPRDADAVGGCRAEGCYVDPLRFVPDGALAHGRTYLVLATPAGGATCTSTATIVFAIPIDPFVALVAA